AGQSLHYVDVIAAAVENARRQKVLDVGIAYGIYDVVLKRRFGFEVCGIDHPHNIDAYCRFPIKHGIPVIACDLHFDSIPFEENTFDTVIASEIVEHLFLSPKALFAKLYPVLKPEGKLIVTTPNFASLLNIVLLIKNRNPAAPFPDEAVWVDKRAQDPRVHPREYTVKEIESALLDAGFKVCSINTKANEGATNHNWRWVLLKTFMRFTPNHNEKIVAIGTKKNRNNFF
ncbi:class I SAM-dependent methyltransferase, partial [bacterium]|nr:class I SAM-dependent methyltransferase [bacterium]